MADQTNNVNVLLDKIHAIQQVNHGIIARIEQLKHTEVPRFQFSLSPIYQTPITVNMFERVDQVDDILAAWRPKHTALESVSDDSPFMMPLLAQEISCYDDLPRFNDDLVTLAIQVSTYMHEDKNAAYLTAILHSMELVQVNLGEVETTLADPNNDILEVTRQVQLINDTMTNLHRMPSMCRSTKLHFDPTLVLQGALNEPNELVVASTASSGGVCIEQFSTGVVMWRVQYEGTNWQSLGVTCATNTKVLKTPTTPKLGRDFYGVCWNGSGVRHITVNDDDPRQAEYDDEVHASGTQIFDVTLNCIDCTLTIACPAWSDDVIVPLPPNRTWRPYFRGFSCTIILLDDE